MVPVRAGVDISKEQLDVCVMVGGEPQFRRFPNTFNGFLKCLKWFQSFAETVEFAFEPTGRYGELFVEYMHGKGCLPLQVQPFQMSRFAESLDTRVKSDHKDAYALARYCAERRDKCRIWKQKTSTQQELRDLQLLLNSLTKRKIAIKCQLSCLLRSEYVKADLEAELETIEERLQRLLSRSELLIRSNEQLSDDLNLLLGIPGVGLQTAVMLLTLVDFRAFSSGRSVACFLGLTQRKHESGTSIHGKERMSKRGSTCIRSQLFMPARASRKFDEAMGAFAQRLITRGKHDHLVQVAVIRRMVTVAWAIVTKATPYSADYRHPLAPI